MGWAWDYRKRLESLIGLPITLRQGLHGSDNLAYIDGQVMSIDLISHLLAFLNPESKIPTHDIIEYVLKCVNIETEVSVSP